MQNVTSSEAIEMLRDREIARQAHATGKRDGQVIAKQHDGNYMLLSIDTGELHSPTTATNPLTRGTRFLRTPSDG